MTLENIQTQWDLVVIGGGITGAGVLREAVRRGLRTLLVEQNDFAWGTSSRSSKMVHGGLRYLKDGRVFLTRDSVVERERFLTEAEGLVEKLGFLMPIFSDHGSSRWLIEIGLSVYDLLAWKKQHCYYDSYEFSLFAPHVRTQNLIGGFYFTDAQVDDARLVLRVIKEAKSHGGEALNYVKAKNIIRDAQGNLTGVLLQDTETLIEKNISAKAVINATGSWSETIHPSPQPNLHLRPLRGSHLIFPYYKLPVSQTISFEHPDDKRPVFAVPWEGAIFFGTTDVDNGPNISDEPKISKEEVTYLMDGIKFIFPGMGISKSDCLGTIAGIRPVLSEGDKDPSKESREHVVWVDKGLVTITGGKLTTFRKLALDALSSAKPFLPAFGTFENDLVFSKINIDEKEKLGLSTGDSRRLFGRYGNDAQKIVYSSNQNDLTKIPGTNSFWAELPFAAKNEDIRHLSDLLLRRVRIGLLTPFGGKNHLDRVRSLCEPVLNWDDTRWKKEIKDYSELWDQFYGTPK